MRTGTNGKASGHKGRATRRALRLYIKIKQSRAFRRELIDARRGCAAQYAAPVTAHFAVAKIVHQNENNVRLLAIAWRVLRQRNRW